MNKYFFRICTFFCAFLISGNTICFSQDFEHLQQEDQLKNTMVLPEITTYIPSSLENKITIKSEQIQNHHYQNILQLLSDYSVQILSYGDYGLEQKPSIRGFTDETVRVVIDGVCMNNPQTGTFDFSTINVNNIEEISIVKGGYNEGTEDEGAVGGVIYITTKKNFEKNIISDTKIKTFFNPQTPLDLISQNFQFSIPFSQNIFANFDLAATKAENNFQANNSKVYNAHSNANITSYFGNGNSFSISDISYLGFKNLPGPEHSKNLEKQQDFQNKLTLSLFSPNVSPIFTLKSNLSWNYSQRFYQSKTEKSEHKLNDFSLSTFFDFFTVKKFKQKVGFTIDYVYLDSTNTGNRQNISFTAKETSQIKFNNLISLNIPFGFKFSNKNFALLPKLALSFDFKGITQKLPLQIIINAYKLTQFPTMDDLYWKGSNFFGNENLKPETGYGSEVSFNFNFPNANNSGNLLSLNFFTVYYENKIQWSYNNNFWQPQNVASAFYFGIDFSLAASLFQNHLNFSLNAEYLYTKLLDKTNRLTYGKKIMWTPDFTCSAQVSVNFTKWNAGFCATYTGKRYISNLNINFLEPYVLLSLTAEFHPNKIINFYFRGDNLLNTKYESIENYKMPGINATFGVKILF